MVRRFGLTTNGVKHDAPLVLMVAQTRCACCRDLDRCHCFLEGAADAELSTTITAAGRPRVTAEDLVVRPLVEDRQPRHPLLNRPQVRDQAGQLVRLRRSRALASRWARAVGSPRSRFPRQGRQSAHQAVGFGPRIESAMPNPHLYTDEFVQTLYRTSSMRFTCRACREGRAYTDPRGITPPAPAPARPASLLDCSDAPTTSGARLPSLRSVDPPPPSAAPA